MTVDSNETGKNEKGNYSLSIEMPEFGIKNETRKDTGLKLEDIQIKKVESVDFAAFVLESEMADDRVEEEDTHRKLRELGCFSPVRGMANIQNILGDAMYARIYRDETKKQYLEFCQKYRDGRYSPIMRLPQAGMLMAARYNFVSKEIAEATIRNRVAKFVMMVCEEYDSKFCGDLEELLNIVDVLNVLFRSMPQLPVYEEESSEIDAAELYRRIEQHAAEFEGWKLYEHSSYYMFDDEGVQKLAHAIGMKKLDMLRQMKKNGFLYLTGSSSHYQTNARFTDHDGESFTEWVYCVYKLGFLAGVVKK